MTAQRTAVRPDRSKPDHEAVIARAIEYHGFDSEDECAPKIVMKALHEALIAYVRSRRDPDAARLVLLDHLPAMVEAIEDHLRDTLRSSIAFHAERAKKHRAKPNPSTEDALEDLRIDKAVRLWLYGV